MIYRLYEHLLQAQIRKDRLPGCVAIVLGSGDLSGDGLYCLRQILDWSLSIDLPSIIIHVSGDEPELQDRIASLLASAPAQISLHTANGIEQTGSGGFMKVLVSLDYGGKREVAEAFRKILQDVEDGKLNAEQIDEATIESHLRFSEKPDLVIRAGGKRLSDFMIWQAAYSELYFTDVNWQKLRKIDFLRAIRDSQGRKRRFGR